MQITVTWLTLSFWDTVGGQDVSRHLTLEIKRRVRLDGVELDEFFRKKKEKEMVENRKRSVYFKI